MLNNTMNTQDAVSANFAECFVTLNGTRYSMLMAKEFEGKASINTKEVYKLGSPVVGHKAQTVALCFVGLVPLIKLFKHAFSHLIADSAACI